MTLVLFETPAGFALFKVLDQGKLKDAKAIEQNFLSAKKAQGLVKLKSFEKFANTAEATKATAELVEGKLGKTLKGFLKNELKVHNYIEYYETHLSKQQTFSLFTRNN